MGEKQAGPVISVAEHERRLRDLPCAVSARRPITLHHCHGGSIKELGWHVGVSQRQNPFLQIPLHADYHTGKYGIDTGYGVESWERDFGPQVEHLAWVRLELVMYPVSIWELAEAWEKLHRGKAQGAQVRG